MGYGLSFIPVPVMAAIGPQLATEMGDVSKNLWFVSSWIVSITICFAIVGANTDLLGRRWFLVGGNAICAVGHIVLGCAKSNDTIIAGMVITGFGAANCQLAAFALTELLPNKWRHIGVVLADVAVYLTITVIPVTARYGFYAGDWRGNFYAAAIAQFLSFLGLYFFYHPPAHPLGLPYGQVFREMDYLGIFLFIAGSLPILMGIVWASVYSSTSAHVVAPLVVGCVLLAVFAVWETYGNAKHPITPTNIFTSSRGRDFTAPCIALAVINMFYYSSSIIWPTMIAVFYTEPTDWRRQAVLSLPQGLAITGGGVALSLFGSKIRHWQWQQTVAVTIMVLFGTLLALGTPTNMGLVIAFLVISLFAYGWAIYLSIAITQMGVEQEQLGTSGGLSGCARFAGGTIAQAVYLAIQTSINNRESARLVPAAAIAAGLPADKVPALLAIMSTPKFATSYSPQIVAAVGAATQEAVRKGLQGICWAGLGFGIVGILACLCCKDVDAKMTNKIEVYLENTDLADRNKYH
ncbi:fungal trichothecene efflux pump [Tricladium varicosporioides]|nr:fungal trichothecene efflux pump [Hymenoscyphus varicosporioides]